MAIQLCSQLDLSLSNPPSRRSVNMQDYRGFIEQYMQELRELTFNSKLLINNLTVLAEDHKGAASSIVAAIERHLSTVRFCRVACPQHAKKRTGLQLRMRALCSALLPASCQFCTC